MGNVAKDLVDEASLEAYLSDHFGGHGLSVERHQAGHSNETFFVTFNGRELVLRRPPLGAFLPTAHDVGREYRVLSALAGTSVRAPRTILHCGDSEVIGAPFYLMERLHGTVIRTELPEWMDEKEREATGLDLVDALVELHSVDPLESGLEDFGRPTGYLERQLRRWRGQLDLTLPFTRPLPDLEEAGLWLKEHLPASPPGTLVHGDYKLDNVIVAPDPPARIAGILDWEMSTLGDPLADLGWMVSFWADEGEEGLLSDQGAVTASPGFPSRAELVSRYAERTGRDVSALDWYRVLAVWKLAILLEGSYARHLAGATDDPFFAEMEHGVPSLARFALDLAASA